MPQIEIELLSPLATKYTEGVSLTQAERAEVLRIAKGYACKDSAAEAGIASETVRARRKRIYRKCDVAGSSELISQLLAVSLTMLSRGERFELRQAPAEEPGRVSAGAP